MKLEQSFSVAAPIEQVWNLLVDVERIAPCLPGAEVTGVDESGAYQGTFSVKLGPTTASYRGTLKMEAVDEAARTATMSAKGTDKRGQGGASATIVSTKDLAVVGEVKFALKGMRPDDITPVGIALGRDGRRAFVALGRANHVAFVDVAARKVTDLVLVGKRAWNVTLDKAEKQLWVVNGLSDDVTVVDVGGAKPLKSIPVGRVPYGLVIVE